jgi:hypothetical protein
MPMTILDILNLNDNATDDLTRNSPPITNKVNPKTTKIILINIFFCEDSINESEKFKVKS